MKFQMPEVAVDNVADIVQTTIREIYPHYYPVGLYNLFLISTARMYLKRGYQIVGYEHAYKLVFE